jgi:hypothetical protein
MENNFNILLRSKIIQRLMTFALFKLFFGLFFYYLVIRFTQLVVVSYFFRLDFEFLLADYIKLYLLSVTLDLCKLAVFQKYDFPYSYLSQFTKLILDPDVQTFYIFVGSGLTYLMISLLDYTDRTKESTNVLMIIYSYICITIEL